MSKSLLLDPAHWFLDIRDSPSSQRRGEQGDDRATFIDDIKWGDQQIYIGVVADGVSTTTGGALASEIAVKEVRRFLRGKAHENSQKETPSALATELRRSIESANEAILRAADADVTRHRMSTTVVLAAIENSELEDGEDGARLYVMHMGDSRAYLVRDNQIHQLTLDHTTAQFELEAKRISQEELRNHPKRNQIQRYLGKRGRIEIDDEIYVPGGNSRVNSIIVKPGDALLLCTDGAYNRVSDDEILQVILAHWGDSEGGVRSLLQAAESAGEQDDATALLVYMPLKSDNSVNYIKPNDSQKVINPSKQKYARRFGIPLLAGVILSLLVTLTPARNILASLIGNDLGTSIPPTATVTTAAPTATFTPLSPTTAATTAAPTVTFTPLSPTATATTAAPTATFTSLPPTATATTAAPTTTFTSLPPTATATTAAPTATFTSLPPTATATTAVPTATTVPYIFSADKIRINSASRSEDDLQIIWQVGLPYEVLSADFTDILYRICVWGNSNGSCKGPIRDATIQTFKESGTKAECQPELLELAIKFTCIVKFKDLKNIDIDDVLKITKVAIHTIGGDGTENLQSQKYITNFQNRSSSGSSGTTVIPDPPPVSGPGNSSEPDSNTVRPNN